MKWWQVHLDGLLAGMPILPSAKHSANKEVADSSASLSKDGRNKDNAVKLPPSNGSGPLQLNETEK